MTDHATEWTRLDDDSEAGQVSTNVLTIVTAAGETLEVIGTNKGANVMLVDVRGASLEVMLSPLMTKAVVRYLVDFLAVIEAAG